MLRLSGGRKHRLKKRKQNKRTFLLLSVCCGIVWYAGCEFRTGFLFALEQNDIVSDARVQYEKGAYDDAFLMLQEYKNQQKLDRAGYQLMMDIAVKRADDALAKKHGELAVVYLEHAGKAALEGQLEVSPLAERYAEMARLAASNGQFMLVEQYLKKALNTSDTFQVRMKLSEALFPWAQEFYAERNYTRAAHVLNRVIEFDAQKAEAYELRGDCFYFQDDLVHAQEEWKRALKLYKEKRKQGSASQAAIDTVLQKLNRRAHDADLEKELRELSLPHYRMKYDPRISEDYRDTAAEYLEEAYRVITRDFHYYPQQKITVIVYETESFEKAIGPGHQLIGALYDGKIRLPAITDSYVGWHSANKQLFELYVWHEVTHALVHALAGDACPRWINEGIAQYEESRVNDEHFSRTVSVVIPLEHMALWTLTGLKIDGIRMYYDQAYSMTCALIDQYGFPRLKVFLGDLKEGGSYDESFKKRFSKTPAAWFREWEQTQT